jgi:hypothetical protein
MSFIDHRRVRLEEPDSLFSKQETTHNSVLLRIDEGLGDKVVPSQEAARRIAGTKLLAKALLYERPNEKRVQLHACFSSLPLIDSYTRVATPYPRTSPLPAQTRGLWFPGGF